MLAGLAINLSGTVFVHGLGYYLTEKYGIPHGLANSLFLTQFIEYCSEKASERLLSLCGRLGIKSEECSRVLTEKINAMRRYAELPTSLREAGIPEADFQNIVEQALSYSRNIQNCVTPPSREDLEAIVKKAF